MRIHGFCEKCHKIRVVRVSHFKPQVNVQTGICTACELAEDRERNERFKRQKGKKK